MLSTATDFGLYRLLFCIEKSNLRLRILKNCPTFCPLVVLKVVSVLFTIYEFFCIALVAKLHFAKCNVFADLYC